MTVLAEQAQRIVQGDKQVREHQERAKRHERSTDRCQAQLPGTGLLLFRITEYPLIPLDVPRPLVVVHVKPG